jgi:hypothetical protein
LRERLRHCPPHQADDDPFNDDPLSRTPSPTLSEAAVRPAPLARKLLSWPKICKLAHAFRWEYSYKG